MDELVSVIVPIYNATAYLADCIDHLISQTYKNIEIILVNDGSKDNSGEICKQYTIRDSRIKYLEQENSGVGAARNAGLKIATGQYVMFCDSDDYIQGGGIAFLVNHKDEAELIVGGIEKSKRGRLTYHKLGNQTINGRLAIARAINTYMYYINPPWNKLFRMDVISKYGLKYNLLNYGEDTCFVYEYLSKVTSVCFISDIVYHVNVVPESLSTKNVEKPWDSMEQVFMLGNFLIPHYDEKDRYELLLHVIKTSLLLEIRNGKQSFMDCCKKINLYMERQGLLFEQRDGFYNKVIYQMLRKKKYENLYHLMRFRANFL